MYIDIKTYNTYSFIPKNKPNIKFIDNKNFNLLLKYKNCVTLSVDENNNVIVHPDEAQYQTLLKNIKQEKEQRELAKQKKLEKQQLKKQPYKLLAKDDYKIIKCFEAYMLGQELPYDIHALHEEREALREQIRKMEEQ